MKALLDTGPWVALIDTSESAHTRCREWFETFSGNLYSTEPVLTEVLYLLNFSLKAQQTALEFVHREIVNLVPQDIQKLKAAGSLMEKYSDLPMDYADATLVTLAAEAEIDNIVTLDQRDFSIYRLPDNQSFNIHP